MRAKFYRSLWKGKSYIMLLLLISLLMPPFPVVKLTEDKASVYLLPAPILSPVAVPQYGNVTLTLIVWEVPSKFTKFKSNFFELPPLGRVAKVPVFTPLK